jgi:hypothetical protein
MKKKIRYLGILLVIVFFAGCQDPRSRDVVWVGCVLEIDSAYVSKRATRGAFRFSDSLAMWDGFDLIDSNDFNKIIVDPARLDLWGGRNKYCTLADLQVPFWLHKKAGSDTLFIVQSNKTFLFRIPAQFCGDPDDYWKGP